ncbi:sporulation protein [Streptomyces sp. ODS28]|uniref:sporulation protein n=1 Tax=Streptomyces sp. ODS28 TaxID=3136688 RepID=UPI0031E90E77
MVFKKLLGALGVGGPSVDTVLQDGAATPGGTLTGTVRLQGGKSAVDIERITLELVARVEAEGHGGEHGEEHEGTVGFDRHVVGGGFRLDEGEEHEVPFTLTLPWQTPLTELHGQPLGVVLGVRTELEVAGAKDKGDLDALAVAPLPVQEAVLEAFGRLEYGFASADLELGHIGGTGQELPFYQEIELSPPPRYADAVNEIEVTFLPHPRGMEVVLEADKRGGFFTGGHDAVHRFTVTHEDAARTDWNEVVDGWVRELVEHRGGPGHFGHHQGPYGEAYGERHGDSYAHKEHGDAHGHHGDGSSKSGTGKAVAAGAAGLAVGAAGGFVASELIDELGDSDEEEDGEEEEG